LNDFPILIAEKREISAQPGSEGGIDLRRIDAHHSEFTIIDRQLFLEFDEMAQLHLAFASPVTAVERQDEGKFPHQLRKLGHLAVLIGKLDIREAPSDALIHVSKPFLRLKRLRRFT
jgi:hypothetical protein